MHTRGIHLRVTRSKFTCGLTIDTLDSLNYRDKNIRKSIFEFNNGYYIHSKYIRLQFKSSCDGQQQWIIKHSITNAITFDLLAVLLHYQIKNWLQQMFAFIQWWNHGSFLRSRGRKQFFAYHWWPNQAHGWEIREGVGWQLVLGECDHQTIFVQLIDTLDLDVVVVCWTNDPKMR